MTWCLLAFARELRTTKGADSLGINLVKKWVRAHGMDLQELIN
jgi:hypothetical protein